MPLTDVFLYFPEKSKHRNRREYVLFVRATGNPATDSPPSPTAVEHTDATPQSEGNDESSCKRVEVTVGANMKGDGESFLSPASLPFPQLSLNASGKDASITAASSTAAAGASASAVQQSLTRQQHQCHPANALGVQTGCGVTISGSVFVEGVGGAFPQEKASQGQDAEEEKYEETKQIWTGPSPLSPHGALLPSTTMFNPACGGGVTLRSQSLSSISDQTDPESFSGGSDCDEDRDDAVRGRDGPC